jgi:hypothetical protein
MLPDRTPKNRITDVMNKSEKPISNLFSSILTINTEKFEIKKVS